MLVISTSFVKLSRDDSKDVADETDYTEEDEVPDVHPHKFLIWKGILNLLNRARYGSESPEEYCYCSSHGNPEAEVLHVYIEEAPYRKRDVDCENQ